MNLYYGLHFPRKTLNCESISLKTPQVGKYGSRGKAALMEHSGTQGHKAFADGRKNRLEVTKEFVYSTRFV